MSDPNARACFIGVHGGTTRGCMCRALLEGICFAVRSLLPLLPEAPRTVALEPDALAALQAAILAAESGITYYGEGARYQLPDGAATPQLPPLTLVGGVACSDALPQILADVLQREVTDVTVV